ncbi:MAG: TonB-dependent receptor plug domain-containing protein, partial [Halioglobus sp.]
MTKGRCFRQTSLGILLLTPGILSAQQQTSYEGPGVLEELIVTATRRESSLQDVSIGVSLLSGEAIAKAHLANTAELTQMIATLNAQTGATAGDSSFNIRGIGTQAFSAGSEPSVSTVVDGVVLSRSGMAFSSMLDVQRVEVLRGPQGTLYGKNASGGVIHIITRDPTQKWGGSVSATAIEDDEYRMGATVSGPLTDTVGVRLTGQWLDDAGYATNVYDNSKLNGVESKSLRGKINWQPSDDFNLLWSSDYYDSDCSCNALTVRAVLESDQQDALLEELLPVVPAKDNFDANNDQETRDEVTAWGHSLTINTALGNYDFTSITAYRDWENTQAVDVDNRPTNPLTLMLDSPPHTEVEQFSQEFRLNSKDADWG